MASFSGAFDVRVCCVTHAEETSAVGSPPATIPVKSRRTLLTCKHVRKLWCFFEFQKQRQLYEYQSGQCDFLKNLLVTSLQQISENLIKTWKPYYTYQTQMWRNLVTQWRCLQFLIYWKYCIHYYCPMECSAITTFAVFQVNSLTHRQQSSYSRSFFTWSRVSFGFVFAPPAAADTSHTLRRLRQMQMSVSSMFWPRNSCRPCALFPQTALLLFSANLTSRLVETWTTLNALFLVSFKGCKDRKSAIKHLSVEQI